MNGIKEQLELIASNLKRLGSRRLIALAAIGGLMLAGTGLSAWFLSRPSFEILYAGLDKADVTRIGAALKEAGITFDVAPEGDRVMVKSGSAAQARMFLAERGLPHTTTAGYELFDKMGSLGLTSFMQDVTRLRAVEGELARTIQLIKGVRAARVHIVQSEEGSLRRVRQAPTAAVILRLDQASDASPAAAIRHLVSAAVPGLKPDQVTIVGSDGSLIASGDDPMDTAPHRLRALEKSVSQEIQENVRRTLSPHLSLRNFQISVLARLNTDKRETNETVFNPESRVERSVRVVRENQSTQNSSQQAATSVERNLPQDQARPTPGKQSNEENQKREEVTNYELSSKKTTTLSAGYLIENISVAVLINRASIAASMGSSATPEAINERLTELEGLITSAAGLRRDRGDVVKVSALDFNGGAGELEPVASPGLMDYIARDISTLINVGAALLVSGSLLFFGVRPLINLLSPQPEVQAPPPQLLPGSVASEEAANTPEDETFKMVSPLKLAQRKLEQIVEADEARAAEIMKQWIRAGRSA